MIPVNSTGDLYYKSSAINHRVLVPIILRHAVYTENISHGTRAL